MKLTLALLSAGFLATILATPLPIGNLAGTVEARSVQEKRAPEELLDRDYVVGAKRALEEIEDEGYGYGVYGVTKSKRADE